MSLKKAENRELLTAPGSSAYHNSVLICLILLILSTLLSPFALFYLLQRYFEAKQATLLQDIETLKHQWFSPGPNGTPSPIQSTMGDLGAVVGSAAARSIMASLKQVKSSEAVVANSLADGIQAQVDPLALLIGSTRRGGKGAAIERLVGFLREAFKGSGNSGSGSVPEGPRQGSLGL